MRKGRLVALLLTFSMLIAMALTGCGGDQAPGSDSNGKLMLGYVEWDSEISSTHVIKEVLEQEGFEVEARAVDAALMFQGLGRGDFDAIVSAWLPDTHKGYYEKIKNDVDNAGANLKGARIGLVVPSYMDIDSIDDLNSIKDQVDGNIIGIEPGAGIMLATEDAIDEYDLDYRLLDSSSASMAAELSSAIKNEEPIIVTGWTPHWKFAKFDLKYLDDPKGVYGGEEEIVTLVRKGFKDDNAKAYDILSKFNWLPEDMETVMLKIQEGLTPEEAAKEWVEDNAEKVNE